MEYYKIEKKDGITIKSECNKIDPSKIGNNKNSKHLCWNNCSNGFANKCEKIYDHRKRIISDYDFIKSGYQIINEYNELKKFVVTECDNYKEKKPEKMSLADYRNQKEQREKFIMSYYGANSMEEVKKIEKHDSYIKKLTR